MPFILTECVSCFHLKPVIYHLTGGLGSYQNKPNPPDILEVQLIYGFYGFMSGSTTDLRILRIYILKIKNLSNGQPPHKRCQAFCQYWVFRIGNQNGVIFYRPNLKLEHLLTNKPDSQFSNLDSHKTRFEHLY